MDKCQTCDDTTKFVSGLWDGANGAHGRIFDCYNLECGIKQDKIKGIIESENDRMAVKLINQNNGIFAEIVKQKRKSLQITIREMSDELGIRCSLYSDYEQCRKRMPTVIMDKINKIFSGKERGE